MKNCALFLALILRVFSVHGQENVSVGFKNDTQEVYHLSLIIYTPDGKIQTRVSDLAPDQIKSYSLPVKTEIFIANREQEAFAMQGNDIKATGVKPFWVVQESNSKIIIKTSSITQNNQLNKKDMSEEKKVSAAEKMLGDFAPRLLGYTDKVLFGDVWEGKELSRRERSLITVAALVAGEHSNQLKFHLDYAKEHGLTEAELVEVITHLAFYVGWPKAMTAIMIAKEAF